MFCWIFVRHMFKNVPIFEFYTVQKNSLFIPAKWDNQPPMQTLIICIYFFFITFFYFVLYLNQLADCRLMFYAHICLLSLFYKNLLHFFIISFILTIRFTLFLYSFYYYYLLQLYYYILINYCVLISSPITLKEGFYFVCFFTSDIVMFSTAFSYCYYLSVNHFLALMFRISFSSDNFQHSLLEAADSIYTQT